MNIPLIGTAPPRIVSAHHANNPAGWPESLPKTEEDMREF
jgi:hypothetical protein